MQRKALTVLGYGIAPKCFKRNLGVHVEDEHAARTQVICNLSKRSRQIVKTQEMIQACIQASNGVYGAFDIERPHVALNEPDKLSRVSGTNTSLREHGWGKIHAQNMCLAVRLEQCMGAGAAGEIDKAFGSPNIPG